MRVVIQRVSRASVKTAEGHYQSINKGLMVLVGVGREDTESDADWLAAKITSMRIFDDEAGVMNNSLQDVSGELLVVSQFTLHARTKKGNRPSYLEAALPEKSVPLYDYFVRQLNDRTSHPVATGVFGAHMEVELVNDGPVTIVMDTHHKT
ncbi:D-aminoacyl-tRNA deacylase [Geofilum rubicundum]|uniref:D-aminoacyl-tRNA deacylase n=1 Tax=Geofilum rubicundum TaxID=472113 RepID=UPI0007843ED0|nr:D-aminoacyl-tRNA deacylase [Geofilum rubicundum]